MLQDKVMNSLGSKTATPIAEPSAEAKRAQSGTCKNAAMFCPNCSAELQAHRCKMVCKKCGFYMNCSDFY